MVSESGSGKAKSSSKAARTIEQATCSEMERRETRAASTEGAGTSGDEGSSHGHADDEDSAAGRGKNEDADGGSSQGACSRPQRTKRAIERLGVVPDTRRRTVKKARKRTPKELVYMERTGAAGGELKYLIRIGAVMRRRMERQPQDDQSDDSDRRSARGNTGR